MQKVLKWIVVVLAGMAVIFFAAPFLLPPDNPPHGSLAQVEFENVFLSSGTMMVYNEIFSIPNVSSATSEDCTKGSNEMDAWPDSTSLAGSEGKRIDPNGRTYQIGDKAGYVLFGHDITADNNARSLVNYLTVIKTSLCYTVEPDGTFHQYTTAGTEVGRSPAPSLPLWAPKDG